MNHLLKMMDLTGGEILGLLDVGRRLKDERKRGDTNTSLRGKTLAMIFQKASTRTRVSFEAGMLQMGGHALFLSANDLQMGRGEPLRDTARVLSRYVDGIMIRTFAQQDVEDLAKFGSIPVINGLTDDAHPCQALADLMTIQERKGSLSGRKLCFIGDGNNVANSLIVAGLKTGMTVSIAAPKGRAPHPAVLSFASTYGGLFTLTEDPREAVSGADAVYTDVWTSMGQESEAGERRALFEAYQLNDALLAHARPDAIVLHCLPAHREEEITESVFEAHAAEIFDQAENRLHAQKAVLLELMGA